MDEEHQRITEKSKEEARRIRDKWSIPSNPDKVSLVTEYFTLNEPGYKDRLQVLNQVSGTAVSVGATDRAFAMFASMDKCDGSVLVEANPYFTEVGVPYYAEAVLFSQGDPEKLKEFFATKDDLLSDLAELAYKTHSKRRPISNLQNYHDPFNKDSFIKKFHEGRTWNQEYLGKESWTKDPNKLTKLYTLAKEQKVKGYSADISENKTWEVVKSRLKKMSGISEPTAIDVSNIHSRNWIPDFRRWVQTLQSTFDVTKDTPIVFASGPSENNQSLNSDRIMEQYADDPILGKFAKSNTWNNESLLRWPNGKVPVWASRGIWPLIPGARKPN